MLRRGEKAPDLLDLVSRERLERIEAAEAGLRVALANAGIVATNLRVRDLGEQARVEVDAAAVQAVTDSPQATAAVRAAGFDSVEVDPRGFRSGAMNELLADPSRWR